MWFWMFLFLCYVMVNPIHSITIIPLQFVKGKVNNYLHQYEATTSITFSIIINYLQRKISGKKNTNFRRL